MEQENGICRISIDLDFKFSSGAERLTKRRCRFNQFSESIKYGPEKN